MNCGTIVLTTPKSRQAEAAQRWLLTAEGTIPDVHALAQAVNGYDRMNDWDKINAWLEDMLSTLHSKDRHPSKIRSFSIFSF